MTFRRPKWLVPHKRLEISSPEPATEQGVTKEEKDYIAGYAAESVCRVLDLEKYRRRKSE